MDLNVHGISPEDIQSLIGRVQALEYENNRLRSEAIAPSTPPPATYPNELRGRVDYKVIPKPEKYDGERAGNKVREFSRKMKRYLKCLVQVDQSLHCDIIAGFLVGAAYTWFTRWERNNSGFNAQELLDALVDHFSPANLAQDARNRLASFKQKGPVQKYAKAFREILEDIEGIDEMEAKTFLWLD